MDHRLGCGVNGRQERFLRIRAGGEVVRGRMSAYRTPFFYFVGWPHFASTRPKVIQARDHGFL